MYSSVEYHGCAIYLINTHMLCFLWVMRSEIWPKMRYNAPRYTGPLERLATRLGTLATLRVRLAIIWFKLRDLDSGPGVLAPGDPLRRLAMHGGDFRQSAQPTVASATRRTFEILAVFFSHVFNRVEGQIRYNSYVCT